MVKLKKLLEVDLSSFDKSKFYCGHWGAMDTFTKIYKFFTKLFFTLKAINMACFKHDSRYYSLFNDFAKLKRSKKNTFLLILYKFIIDVYFLFDMLNSSLEEKGVPTYQLRIKIFISIIFFLIVVLATPIYIYIIFKRFKNKQK